MFAKSETVKACYEAAAAREVAKAAEDIVVAAADEAQDIGLQAGFKILCRVLLQMALDFDVKVLDALVIMDMINVVVLEAKAEIGPGQVNTKGKGPTAQAGGVGGTLGIAAREPEVVKAPLLAAGVVLFEESTETAPTEGSVKVALAGDNAEVVPVDAASVRAAN